MKIKLLAILFGFTIQLQVNASCEAPEHRQFDFWLGQWQVSNTQNTQVSRNNISLINNGCTLLEEYSTPSGYVGKSLNIYDASNKSWHQTWTDNTGMLLQLDGQLEGRSMVLKGKTTSAENEIVLNKITWTPNTNGTVRQLWQTSQDQGKNWQTVFDGTYRKVRE